jgi:hypothetical protein
MSNFSMSVFLSAYGSQSAGYCNPRQSSNAPSQSAFKWNFSLNSLPTNGAGDESFTVAPGQTLPLFSGTRTLAQDGTTEYSIALKTFYSSTYILSWTGGTAPNFRTPRSTGADATTQVTVTQNGPIVTFTSTGGTNFALGGVQVGDWVTLGNLFNPLNQGSFQIIALTTTSFTINNPTGTGEGPITLGSGFVSQVQIYSAAGVQIGDTLSITSGFSLVTQGSYKITAVYAESLEFSYTGSLPQETNIMTEVSIYSDAKQLIYVESSQKVSLIINGVNACDIEPFLLVNCANGCPANQNGVFMLKSTIYSLSVVNNGVNPANVLLISIE